MAHTLSQKAKLTEADIACEVLRDHGTPLNYLVLIEKVLNRLGIPQEAVRIAAVLTQINLDARFVFQGNGEWGLKVWVPTKSHKKGSSISMINKGIEAEDGKADLEDIETLELLEEDSLETDDAFDEAEDGVSEEKW